MAKRKESVAKGGSSVAGARLLGMVLSFLLFLVLARHSASDAGVFRTVVTYLVIAEFLGMLGMHRWLATELSANPARNWPIFLATNAVMFGVALILIVAYLIIAFSGFYSAEVNQGLRLACLSLIPSAVYQCVQSALVGVGNTYRVGIYNAAEYIARCGASIALIYFGFSVLTVIWVFVLCRWVMASFGFYQFMRMVEASSWRLGRADVAHVLKDAPRFMLIIAAFLLLRNAALVLIPALVHDAEVAIYGVAYQLFDMILIIPSVLAISSNHVFVNKAAQSLSALKRVSAQMASVTALVMFPCMAITAAFAYNFLLFLYGEHYTQAAPALVWLMLAAGLAMIDQVLSQIMTARKDYHSDMLSILVGGIGAVVLTYPLVVKYGANGGAAALMLAYLLTVLTRLWLLKPIFSSKLLGLSIWRPALSAVLIFIVCAMAWHWSVLSAIAQSKYLWLLGVLPALVLYLLVLYGLGGINRAKRWRIQQFLFHH